MGAIEPEIGVAPDMLADQFQDDVILGRRYESGNIAVSVFRSDYGNLWTFYYDKAACVLATFDHRGVGSINHRNGRPWLVVTLTGWSLSDADGRLQMLGAWPRKDTTPIRLDPDLDWKIEFVDRQQISVQFSQSGAQHTFQCGDRPRRTASYLDGMVGKKLDGRLELDISRIRKRQQDIGSIYVPKGPHHMKTPLPGVGILPTLVKSLADDSPVVELIAQQTRNQERIAALGRICGVSHKSMQASDSGFGALKLTGSQKKLLRSCQSGFFDKPQPYQNRRRKLPLMRMPEFDRQVAGEDAPKDVLMVLCMLSDWNPVSLRLEPKLQEGYRQLLDHRAAADSPARSIEVFKVDASECRKLQDLYDFRAVPMTLMFYERQLVYAANAIRSADELVQEAFCALERARRSEFLPLGFTFRSRGGADSVLDTLADGTFRLS